MIILFVTDFNSAISSEYFLVFADDSNLSLSLLDLIEPMGIHTGQAQVG